MAGGGGESPDRLIWQGDFSCKAIDKGCNSTHAPIKKH
jgi:hypothetical protein